MSKLTNTRVSFNEEDMRLLKALQPVLEAKLNVTKVSQVAVLRHSLCIAAQQYGIETKFMFDNNTQ